MKQLIALGIDGGAIFIRLVRNKIDGRTEILNNPLLALVDRVKYNGKIYSIREIYKWG